MGGHLFVVHGDLTAIACDAVLIPTDAGFTITSSWESLDLRRPAEGWGSDKVVKVRANGNHPRARNSIEDHHCP